MESHPWLVASGDRRVSIWSSEWRRDNSCQLVDWLTFPGPSQAPDGTRLKKANKVLLLISAICRVLITSMCIHYACDMQTLSNLSALDNFIGRLVYY